MRPSRSTVSPPCRSRQGRKSPRRPPARNARPPACRRRCSPRPRRRFHLPSTVRACTRQHGTRSAARGTQALPSRAARRTRRRSPLAPRSRHRGREIPARSNRARTRTLRGAPGAPARSARSAGRVLCRSIRPPPSPSPTCRRATRAGPLRRAAPGRGPAGRRVRFALTATRSRAPTRCPRRPAPSSLATRHRRKDRAPASSLRGSRRASRPPRAVRSCARPTRRRCRTAPTLSRRRSRRPACAHHRRAARPRASVRCPPVRAAGSPPPRPRRARAAAPPPGAAPHPRTGAPSTSGRRDGCPPSGRRATAAR